MNDMGYGWIKFYDNENFALLNPFLSNVFVRIKYTKYFSLLTACDLDLLISINPSSLCCQ